MKHYGIAFVIILTSSSFRASPRTSILGVWQAECLWSTDALGEEANISRLCPLVAIGDGQEMGIGSLRLSFDANSLLIGDSSNSIKTKYRYNRSKLSFVSEDIKYVFKVHEIDAADHKPRKLKLVSKDDNWIMLTRLEH